MGVAREDRGCQGPRFLPFVVTKLVAVVIRRDDINQQDVLGLGVHACDFDLVAGEHPPGGHQGVRQRHRAPGEMAHGVRGQKALYQNCKLGKTLPSLASASPYTREVLHQML